MNALQHKPRSLYTHTWVILFCAFWLIGCESKSMEPENLSMCVGEPKYMPSNLAEGLVEDKERGCMALEFNIPKAYGANLTSPKSNFDFEVSLPSLMPARLQPDDKKKWPFTTEVSVNSLQFSPFSEFIKNRKNAMEISMGAEKTDLKIFGMTVYKQPKSMGDLHYVHFYPDDPDKPIVNCLVGPNEDYSDIKPHYSCEVFSNVDNRVYVNYSLPYSYLKDFNQMNESLKTLITTFIKPVQ